MSDMHMMDYWFHKMDLESGRTWAWLMARDRAHQYAEACGYLGAE